MRPWSRGSARSGLGTPTPLAFQASRPRSALGGGGGGGRFVQVCVLRAASGWLCAAGRPRAVAAPTCDVLTPAAPLVVQDGDAPPLAWSNGRVPLGYDAGSSAGQGRPAVCVPARRGCAAAHAFRAAALRREPASAPACKPQSFAARDATARWSTTAGGVRSEACVQW
jgi:hypothetical protein